MNDELKKRIEILMSLYKEKYPDLFIPKMGVIIGGQFNKKRTTNKNNKNLQI